MIRVFCLLVAALAGCGYVSPGPSPLGPKWDLSQPIYVEVEEHYTADGQPSFPEPDWYRHSFERGIVSAGGTIAPSADADGVQVLTLFDTDGGDCSGKKVFAFSDVANRRTAICHSLAVLNGNYHGDPQLLDKVTLHELGHHFGHKGWHIGGDEVPLTECSYPYIMAWNVRCYIGPPRFADGMDLEYVCNNGGWTIGGICAHQEPI